MLDPTSDLVKARNHKSCLVIDLVIYDDNTNPLFPRKTSSRRLSFKQLMGNGQTTRVSLK